MKDFKLDGHPKIKSGFTVPEGYFDGLSEKITAQLPRKEPKTISIFASRRNWIMAAAAILVVTLVIPVYRQFGQKTDVPDSASLENYLTYQSGISQYDLVNLMDSQDIENLDQHLQLEDETIEETLTNNTNFENYITD